MRLKVNAAIDQIVKILKEWKTVVVASVQHFAEHEVNHPNFSISIDIYYSNEIPNKKSRRECFKDTQFFESSELNVKDRFIMDENLPVRLSYKRIERIETILNAIESESWLSIERGTYLFHRIATGSVVLSRNDWMENVVKRLDSLPAAFWALLLESYAHTLDHLMGDLNAATMNDDSFYFNQSLSDLMAIVARAIFAINHCFEPGPRDFSATLGLMETLPEGFRANWASLLRQDTDLSADRKSHIAELLIKSLVNLRT